MNQPSLFDVVARRPGKARHDHPGTAKQAAVAIIPRAGTARFKVLVCAASWPRSDEQMQDELHMPANTQRPRRVELVEMGLLEPHPDRVATTRAGLPAIVWRVTELGRQLLGQWTDVQTVKVVGDRL